VRATRVRGHVAFFGQSSGPPDPIQPRPVLGSRTLTCATLFDYIRIREELLERAAGVFAAHLEGWLPASVDRVLPLGAAAEAHRLLAGRSTMGKVLLEPR
jgi:NADPH2:quinone reductase